jgi:DNA-directed RNA polymerase subunit RPC12/RpoP
MLGRQCVQAACSPGYFKVRPGTGVTERQEKSYCPYCRAESDPNDFHTSDQLRFVQDIAVDEAAKGLDTMIRDTLGLGSSGHKNLAKGLISIDLEYKPGRRPPVRRPAGEELRRDIRCPNCTLDHAVFGLAIWCPDCGSDVFLEHVQAEFKTIRVILGEVAARGERFGPRVGARDVENSLEDTVSIFEAVLKFITRKHLRAAGQTDDQIEEVFKTQVRNSYQSIERAAETFRSHVGRDLFAGVSDAEKTTLARVFDKRNPITHNLGVVDRKYLERANSGELVGRDIRVTPVEVEEAGEIAFRVLREAYGPTS